MRIAASDETLGLVIKFRIWGALRFLSHAETLSLLQRACVRAGIDLRYTEGFNPRPRLSLPLPRPVGVESDDEVLCLSVHGDAENSGELCAAIAAGLSAQLPEGCELLSVSVAASGASIQPRAATYLLPVRSEYLKDKLRATVDRLMASERLEVRRQTGGGKRRTRDEGPETSGKGRGARIKNIDVRPFLASIEMTGEGIIVECKISPAGSIRVEEALSLLKLDQSALAGPIRRTGVRWQ